MGPLPTYLLSFCFPSVFLVINFFNSGKAEAGIAQVHPEIAASAAERLIDAIEIHHLEAVKNEKDAKHPVLAQLNCSSIEYVIKCVNGIQQQEIESALLLLPVQYLAEFMKICCQSVENRESVEKFRVNNFIRLNPFLLKIENKLTP